MSQASQTRPLLLVVDDEKDTNHALCLMLQRTGYRVAAAYEPYGANTMVQDLLPDGVILDLNMPAGGGRRFFDWMLANKVTARIPVVIYSAQADRETQKELLAMGARAFVDKASPPDVLIATLVSIVGYVPPAERQPAAPPGATYGPPEHFAGYAYQPPPGYGYPAPMPQPGAPYGQPSPEPFPPAGPPPQRQGQQQQLLSHAPGRQPPTQRQPSPPEPRRPRSEPPPPPGAVPYPFTNPDAAPPPSSAPPRQQHGEPTRQQRRLQEQLRVQFEMQQQPQYRPQASAPSEPPPSASPPAEGEEQKSEKALLLLVDDSPDERFSLAVRLRRKGYTVLQASNSHVALELARLNQPDVILTDVHMPGISGLQLCQMLKNQKETKRIPVFLMSGLPQSISKKELDRVGGSGFFEKPIDLNLLLVLLANVDRKKKTAAIDGFTSEALGVLDQLF